MTTATANEPGLSSLTRDRPRWLTPTIVVAVLMLVALALTVLTPGRQGNTDALDPANPRPAGAQSLARVLAAHGVSVTVVRSQRELLTSRVDETTTVAVTGSKRLSGRTAQRALAHAASAAGIVLIDPDPEVTAGMGLPVDSHLSNLENVTADCPGATVGKDFRLTQAHRAYTPRSNTPATSCFPDGTDGGAAMVTLPGSASRPPVTLLGEDSVITNGAILDADNAAIALRLFGASDRLIWYVPSVADVTSAEASSRSIAPEWFQPGLAVVTSAVLFLCLWRGRRLGPLVTEPLPVIVRAVETTESRGRMYRKSRDRSRALAVLQLATRRRLASYLGLSDSTAVSSIAAAAAVVSGRSYHDVLALLSTSVAHNDSSLLERANTLAALEKEVRRS